MPYGYSLEEIQIASDFVHEGRLTKARDPLQFLDSDWAQMTRYTQFIFNSSLLIKYCIYIYTVKLVAWS